MNDNLLPFQRLDIYVAAKELARCVHEASIRDAELRDQATRASKSTFLGICEGLHVFVGGGRTPDFAGSRVKRRSRECCGWLWQRGVPMGRIELRSGG
jgi:hypothetical protein